MNAKWASGDWATPPHGEFGDKQLNLKVIHLTTSKQ